ncbi:hypothetical protein [Adhaeribacter soli]|uniref:DUF6311 domain-containing protein n=1 Tax=Adhaeribacter soli TaxID=2607655 RepID=A0A5N1IPE0_9BACT|nr:hypothetical protein [Adhaeribacter soli]KAA9331874.1 hypothetical protein F0P94_13835 [Adhaeribacter soli]
MRRAGAEGYGWDEWKLTLPALFTPYNHNKIDFLFQSTKNIPYESYAFLGPFPLFGMVLWLLLYLFNKNNRPLLKPRGIIAANYFFAFFGLATVASVLIAIGEEYYFSNREYVFNNYLRGFFYLHKITDMVTQFRCLGRFSWIFFWFINLATVCG